MKKKTISKKILVALSTIGVTGIVTPFIYACTPKQNENTNANEPLGVKPSQPTDQQPPKEDLTNSNKDNQTNKEDQTNNQETKQTDNNPAQPSNEQPSNPVNDNPSNQKNNDNNDNSQPSNENNEVEINEPINHLKTFNAFQPIKNNRKIEVMFEFKNPIPKSVADNTPKSNDPRISNPVDITKFKLVLNNDQELDFASVKKENGIDTAVLFAPNNLNQITIKGLKLPDGTIELLKSYQQKTFDFIDDALGNVDISLASFSSTITNKQDIYPTDIQLSDIRLNITGGNSTQFNHTIKKMDNFLNQKGRVINDWLGAFGLVIEFSNKTNLNQKITRYIYFDGFKNNPIDGVKNNEYNNDQFNTLDQDYVKFFALSKQEQYEKNNPWYVKALERSYEFMGIDEKTFRKDINLNNNVAIDKFNKKAKEIGIENYETSFAKGYTLPIYDENNNFLGLNLYDKKEIGKASVRSNFVGRNQWQSQGLPRMLVNDHYKKIAMQSYSIEFTNKNEKNESFGTAGTIWIMDFEKTENGKYPTKWYFGTNLHVADALKSGTFNAILTKIASDADLNKKFRPFNNDGSFERFFFKQPLLQKGLITKVFEAKDFLNSKPADFLVSDQANKYANLEDYADFAILEFDFSKISDPDEIWAYSADPSANLEAKYDEHKRDGEKLAKLITNDYANNPSVHVSFKPNSYLKNYDEINKKVLVRESDEYNYQGDSLYAVGYPGSNDDYFLKWDPADEDEYDRRKETYSLWTNSDSRFYLNNPKDSNNVNNPDYSNNIVNQGDYLSSQLGYTNFTKKHGIVDAFLTANHIGETFYKSGNDDLVASGLNYLVNGYVPFGGSSGSSFRNQNNELVGIFHSAAKEARVGMIAAFRSEGFDYKELFGNKYNLPQYDLIYGGGKDQKNSYREAMLNLKGNVKTNLFPNGLNEVPSKYKFDK